MIYLGVVVLVFSIYTFLIAGDAIELALGLLRASLAVSGLIALLFHHEMILTVSMFLYALISVLLMAMTRSEVQVKDV